MKISVVIPLYNESGSIEELYVRLKDVLDSSNYDYQIIFVDDGSTDGSYEKLFKIFSSGNNIKVIRLRKNFGKTAALSSAFKEIEGEIIISLDADLQDLPEEIPNLIKKLEKENLDMVSGWRVKRCDSLFKRFFSFIFNCITSLLTGIKIHDFNCGLKVYRKELIKELNLYGELHRYIPVLAVQRGFKVGESKVKHGFRKWGKSKYGAERLFSGFYDFLTILFLTRFRKRPLHLFGCLGVVFLLIGFIISLYFALQWILGNPMHIRPMIVFGWIMIVLGVQFISIGLLADMINTSHKEEEYSVKEILK